MSGWIKLHRRSLDNSLFRKPDVWHYWQYCLLKANHNPKKIIWNKKEMVVDRGSFVTGRKVAAEETGLTERKVRTALNILVSLSMVEVDIRKSTSKFTYLTICNYDKYNDMKITGDQQVTSKRPASDQQVTTNKNIKNNKKVKNLKTLAEREEIFELEFWTVYPPRNGKRREKKKALDVFKKLPEKDIPLVLRGVRYYQASKEVGKGFAKDAFRWLRDESYRDWQMPDEPDPEKENPLDRHYRDAVEDEEKKK